MWFVEAVDVIGNDYTSQGDRLGRGTLMGFSIVDMDVQVVYGSLASVPADVGIAFTSRVHVPPLGQLVVIGPRDLQEFGCENKRGFVQLVSSGEFRSCQTAVNPPSVTITLNETLHQSLHVVIVPGETPRQNPQAALNTFDIFLRAPDGRNLDVALKVPGEPVTQGGRLSVLSLWWTQLLQYDQFFEVTVPLEILDDVDILVGGILIDFPKQPDFTLHSLDVKFANAFGESLYLSSSPYQGSVGDNQLLIRLDKTKRLRTGLTMISFTITRPTQLPLFNFWRVALCGNMGPNGENCTLGELRRDRGSEVICVFASGGFNPFLVSSPQEFRATTGGARKAAYAGVLAILQVLWALM
ncbi:unnamed protein product [Effrenium voratum]|nr:unnamed protein product [Effrenium voratum]